MQEKRFKKHTVTIAISINKNGNYTISITGHNLGGSKSENLAKSNPNTNSIVFNHGSGPCPQFLKIPGNLIHVSNRNDPISFFARSSKGIRKKLKNNIKLHSK